MIDEHGGHALVRWDSLKRNPRRRRETGGAAMAQFFGALHVPVDLVLGYAEIVLENAALPQSRGLLVFADADAFVDEILRLGDPRIGMIGELGVKEPPAWKHRQSDHVEAPFAGDQIGRHRHLADFEFLKFQLAPESLGWMRIGWDDLDAFGLDLT